MVTFFKGAFGLMSGETEATPVAEKRKADLRDAILDQGVTVTWALLLIGQEWASRSFGGVGDPYPVTVMGATAVGYAVWRLMRLVPRYRAS
jgi:hypothetical protein